MIALRVQLRSLPAGRRFQTLLTKRSGIILGPSENGDGIKVALEEPEEERILHGDVTVEVRG